jgi:hypothetical protein
LLKPLPQAGNPGAVLLAETVADAGDQEALAVSKRGA